MNGVRNLTEGSTIRQLFRLALPIMGTSFIQMAYSITDMAWVGRIGSEAVAAVGAVGILTWLTTSVSLLNKVGSEVCVSQKIGIQEEDTARAFASQNITMALLVSLLWGGMLFAFAHPIISLFKLAPPIASDAADYLRIVSSAFPLLFLSATFTGIHNAAGISKVPFLISGTGLLCNMALDPLFILVFGWGTDGAALATWLSQGIVFALFLWQIKGRRGLLGGFPLLVKLRRDYVKRICTIGIPVVLFNALFACINLFMARIASTHGGHIGVMTLTAGGQIEAILWTTAQGISTALSTFIGQNNAAGKTLRVQEAYQTSIKMTILFGSACMLLFLFFGTEVFSLIVPEQEAYIAGGIYLYINGFSMIFMMCEITTQGMFYGLGRTMPPAVISISLNLLRIPLAIVLAGCGMGVEGVWWAISSSSIAKGAVSFLWFRTTTANIRQT